MDDKIVKNGKVRSKMRNMWKELKTVKPKMKRPRTVQCALLSSFLLLSLCLMPTMTVARSRFMTVKIPAHGLMGQKESIDSLVRSLPGVFSTSWNSRHHLFVVVYDRKVTSRRQLVKVIGTAYAQHEEDKESEEAQRSSD